MKNIKYIFYPIAYVAFVVGITLFLISALLGAVYLKITGSDLYHRMLFDLDDEEDENI